MISVCIIEDEPIAQDILIRYCKQHPKLELQSVHSKAESFFDDRGEADLLLVDVNLPGNSGIEFVKQLPKETSVIFTTAYAEYAVDGFNVNAVDYLLKPIDYKRFEEAIERFENRNLSRHNNCITFKSEYKYVRLPVDEILFIEAMRDYIKIQTTSDHFVVQSTLKEMVHQLPDSQFIRIHRSYIIHLDSVSYLEGNQVLIHDYTLPVGSKYKESLLSLFS